jgi:hypothetical protein
MLCSASCRLSLQLQEEIKDKETVLKFSCTTNTQVESKQLQFEYVPELTI